MSLTRGITFLNRLGAFVPKRNTSFKSSISLDKLYPNSSNVEAFKPPINEDKFTGYIPVDRLEISYTKASGPGGQHVNKTNTKVDVRFHVQTADWLPHNLKDKIIEKCGNRINKEGYLVIRSDKTRVQILNQADAVSRLRTILFQMNQAEPELSPETQQLLINRREKAARNRLIEKRSRSDIKASRRPPPL